MYHTYFGIDDQAFSIAVNPRYMYMSSQHKEALAHLLYGVNSGGFVMLTGEVGTGKTTIIRCLLEQLPDTADLAIVLNPSANARDLILGICDEFQITYDPSEKSLKILTDALLEFLVENHKRGRRSIVLIDEAQLLRVSTLEQVRLLTNLETNTQKLLQIILVGQPELNTLLAKPALRQLSQRITARYHLRPLSQAETEAYIKHRLTIAGMPPGRSPFSPRIMRRIYQITHGIPRIINVLCDRLLLGAYSRDTTEVNADICRQAAVEVLGELPSGSAQARSQWLIGGATGAAVALLLGVLSWLWLAADTSVPEPQNPPQSAQIKAVASPAELASPSPLKPTPAAPLNGTPSYWWFERRHAFARIGETHGLTSPEADQACEQFAQQGWHCESQTLATWEELRQMNRAGVLEIVTPGRRKAYIALVGLEADEAVIEGENGRERVSLDELGRLWNGHYTFLWQRPAQYSQPIGKGSRSPLVSWVATQFATLDGQSAPLAQEYFNAQLHQRVILFQRANALADDGYVGLQTLLKLNEALGTEAPLSGLSGQSRHNHAG